MTAKTILQMACLVSILIASTGVATAVAEQPRDEVSIHVSHGGDDPHRVLMALSMAGIMSDDRDVLVYFDIKGINVVLKSGDDRSYRQALPIENASTRGVLQDGRIVSLLDKARSVQHVSPKVAFESGPLGGSCFSAARLKPISTGWCAIDKSWLDDTGMIHSTRCPRKSPEVRSQPDVATQLSRSTADVLQVELSPTRTA